MKDLEQLVDALEFVVDRLSLHVEYEKYSDFRENVKDKSVLANAESMLFNAKHPMGVRVLLAMTSYDNVRHALKDATERLRLHTELHSYDDDNGLDDECDVSENDADRAALNDADEALAQ